MANRRMDTSRIVRTNAQAREEWFLHRLQDSRRDLQSLQVEHGNSFSVCQVYSVLVVAVGVSFLLGVVYVRYF